MKKFMKLIPALAMLLIATTLVSTATYAWFSMNNTVTVDGMKIKAVVSDNLLISDDVISSTAKNDDGTFVNSLTQVVKGILEPVSAIDGKTFYYTATTNVKASGDAIADTYLPYASNIAEHADVDDDDDPETPAVKSTYFNNFSENYGVSRTLADTLYEGQNKAVGYVDYVFQLKAVNTTDGALPIKLTQLDLVYDNATTETDGTKAYRVAFFVEDITSGTATADAGTINAVYTVSGAANFTPGKAVKDGTTVDTLNPAYATEAVSVASVAAHSTKYYKVVVRLWLEGEDNTCNNETFMLLKGEWALNLRMELGGTTTAVANINKVVAS